MVLTSAGEEDLQGGVLQQVAPGEDGPHLGKVPLAMEMVAVFEDLQRKRRKLN